jgi:hypothetical protein
MSVFGGFLGFGILAAGVGLALAGSVPVATVTAVGGILTGAAAVFLFKQADRAKSDAQENLKSISQAAERDESVLVASFYASQMEPGYDRNSAFGTLAKAYAVRRASDFGATPRNSPSPEVEAKED